MGFKTRQPQCFSALAEHLHNSRTAQALSVGQPPITFQMKWFVTPFGAILFERSRHQVGLVIACAGATPARRTMTLRALSPSAAVGAGA